MRGRLRWPAWRRCHERFLAHYVIPAARTALDAWLAGLRRREERDRSERRRRAKALARPPKTRSTRCRAIRCRMAARLTWPINSMPVTYNYLAHRRHRARPRVSKLALMPRIYLARCRRHSDLESGLPGVRADAGHRAEAGRHLQDQSEGDLVRRHADHLGRLLLAVASAATAPTRRIRSRRPPATRTSRTWSAAATTAR